MKAWLRGQGFGLGLFLVAALAIAYPDPASAQGILNQVHSTEWAVALIFCFQGLSLPTGEMLKGCQPFRLHAFVLGWNFIFFPLFVYILVLPILASLDAPLIMGFWMLSILPTTIASATALTAAARGAVPQSIFASIASNLLAVLLVPFLVLAYLEDGLEVSALPVLIQLAWVVCVPLLVGQVLRLWMREWALLVSRRLSWLPHWAILFIVYMACAQSVLSGVLELIQLDQLLLGLLAVCLLLLLVSWAVWRSSKWLRLRREERVAVFFTASQKSIATGLPLLSSVFAAVSMSGEVMALVLFPLLVYHPLQLLLGGLLVARLSPDFTSAPNAQS